MSDKKSDQFSKEETERRMHAALRGARIAGHKTMNDIPKKNGESRAIPQRTKPQQPKKKKT